MSCRQRTAVASMPTSPDTDPGLVELVQSPLLSGVHFSRLGYKVVRRRASRVAARWSVGNAGSNTRRERMKRRLAGPRTDEIEVIRVIGLPQDPR